jgi:asparagine synthase (glutamine-hydrolysing)
MCGICGFIDIENNFSSVPIDVTVKKMCEVIAHRGPDANGVFTDNENRVGLGHQRLSIIDLSNGTQPFFDSEKRFYLVFNGEIYNYKSVRETLANKGVVFRTTSDTEVLLASYMVWGKDCVHRLRGMFAFAIWDKESKELFCSRDHVGIKPLYYYWDGRVFVFASEIKAILEYPNLKNELNRDAVNDYMRFQYIPAPHTIYKYIFKLAAGTSITYHAKKINLDTYWKISQTDTGYSSKEFTERVKKSLNESVELQMVSDVPVGAFLSGGVDSSAVVAIMSQYSDKPIKTNTVFFNDAEHDENKYAKEIADKYNTDHAETLIKMDIKNDLEKIVWHMDEPLADPSIIPTYYLCKATSERVKVCLSGDGGDELFAGYSWYLELQKLKGIKSSYPEKLLRYLSLISAVLLPSQKRGGTFIKNLAAKPWEQHINLVERTQEKTVARILGHMSKSESLIEKCIVETYDRLPGQNSDVVKAAQISDFKTYLVDDVLMKVDKMSMANSLEVRVPLLDHKLVELAMNIPSDMNVAGGSGKKILKNSVQSLLPPGFMERPKHGFTAPVGVWLKNDLKEMFEDMLLSQNTKSSGMFSPKETAKLWSGFMKNSPFDIGKENTLWTQLSFELWHQQYQ